jgi:predicted O-methyltransferase YrrM
MAASLQTCARLCFLAASRDVPILELGSGFSSAALRSVGDLRLVTVDDDLAWLEETGRFLDREGLPRGVLTTDLPRAAFGLVFYDMGNMQTRHRHLEYAVARVARAGYIVLDDVHFEAYGRAAERAVASLNVDREASAQTLDRFGRRALVARRP